MEMRDTLALFRLGIRTKLRGGGDCLLCIHPPEKITVPRADASLISIQLAPSVVWCNPEAGPHTLSLNEGTPVLIGCKRDMEGICPFELADWGAGQLRM